MAERSVFYASNSHTNIYADNTRGSFTSHIDENEFDYLESKRLCAAVKNVTFENKFNVITSRLGYPNMIVIQDVFDVTRADRPLSLKPLWKYEGLFEHSAIFDASSGLDYYLFDKTLDNSRYYGEGKNFALRNFTDIKIVSNDFDSFVGGKSISVPPGKVKSKIIVHNIYFHESSYKSPLEFITYLNYVFANIEYDLAVNPIEKDPNLFSLVGDRVLLHLKEKYNLHIFLSEELRKILGFRPSDLKSEDALNLRDLIADNFKDKEKMSIYYPFPGQLASSYCIIPNPQFDAERITQNEDAISILDMPFQEHEMYYNINIKLVNKYPHFDFIQAKEDLNLSECATGILGLRTSLKEPDIYRNGLYDTQVEFFNVKDHADGIQICEIKSPSFFETTVEKLANAKFELIDIDTNRPANFTLGTPTHIQIVTRSDLIMSKSFNIFLDSSDPHSKSFYPYNKAHDFTIRLPERLEFNKNWEVALKHIFIGNDLFNIYSDSCWIDFQIIRTPPIAGKPTDMPDWGKHAVKEFMYRTGTKNFEDVVQLKKKLRMEDIRLNTMQDVCNYLQNSFNKLGLKLEIGMENERVYIEKKETESYRLVEFKMKLSPYLCNILGFVRGTSKFHNLRFETKNRFVATYAPNIALLVPTNFVVLCDIVSESIFGAKSVNILKLLSSNFDPKKEMIDLSFHQDEFLDLKLKEFSSIRIQIVDTTGNLIKSGKSYATRCQLQFRKKV